MKNEVSTIFSKIKDLTINDPHEMELQNNSRDREILITLLGIIVDLTTTKERGRQAEFLKGALQKGFWEDTFKVDNNPKKKLRIELEWKDYLVKKYPELKDDGKWRQICEVWDSMI